MLGEKRIAFFLKKNVDVRVSLGVPRLINLTSLEVNDHVTSSGHHISNHMART
jgi:hypothetical protein